MIRSIVFGALEQALAAATKRLLFPVEEADVRVAIDREAGTHEAFRRWLVVPDEAGLQEPDKEIILSDARDEDPDVAPDLIPLRETLMALTQRPVNIQASRDLVLRFRGDLLDQPYLTLIRKSDAT